MTRTRLRVATAGLALGGAAIAAYLSYTRVASTAILCPTSGCATVQRSAYAELAGVPVAYVGLVGYLLIAFLALSGRRSAARLTIGLVAIAAGFSSYLLVVQLAVIHAVCTWCVASDVVILSLATVIAVGALAGRVDPRTPRSFSPSPH
jgi:uncharacterized membrane protein